MKKGTSSHPKVADLARALKVETPMALGLLQFLWDFAEDYAPRGDVGRFSDATIAEHCRWRKKPDALIAAMIDTRWLDRSSEYRLIVHDWHEHCESVVHNKIARSKQVFANGAFPLLTRLGKDEKAHAERFYEDLRAHAERTESAPRALSRAPIPSPPPEPLPMPPPEPSLSADAEPSPPEPPASTDQRERKPSGQKRPTVELDEQWTEFRERYDQQAKPGGSAISDQDWLTARAAWNPLDAHQKRERIDAIAHWQGNREPQFWPAPVRFIRTEYSRKFEVTAALSIRGPSVMRGFEKQAATLQIYDAIQRGKAR